VSSSTPFDESTQDYLESSIFTSGDDLDQIGAWMEGIGSVLDVGAGTLHTAGYLAEDGGSDTVGLDPSRPMLREGRQRYDSVFPVQGSSESIPLRQDAFGGVVSRYAAHHFADPECCLREMRRVLKPGGTMVFQDLVVGKADELGDIINRIASLRDPSHEKYRSPEQWEELLRETGFEVCERHQFLLPLTFEDWLNRSDPAPDGRRRVESLFEQLGEDQRRRINLTTSNGCPDTFEYPVAMFRCVPST
jgi:SAM-dependent methyltransferase